jgi:hypothetical protein
VTVSVVEIATFRLATGAEERSFLAVDKRVQTELIANQPGFLRRTTAHREAEWTVVTLWKTEAAAAAFGEVCRGEPVWIEFMERVDPGSLWTHRYETLD